MPDSISGLPIHPLVVHAVVVLLPLAALGVAALALRPTWRSRFGPLVIAIAALATAAIPLATESGESLERQVGYPGQHAQLGDTLIWFAIPLLAAAVALFWLNRRSNHEGNAANAGGVAGRRLGLGAAVSALAVLISLANLVQVYRVGDSGARAVWDGNSARTAARSASSAPR